MKFLSSISPILHTLGSLIIILGLFLLMPIFVNIFYKEFKYIPAFIIPSIICLLFGIALRFLFKSKKIYFLQSLLICGISWIVLAALASLPFIFINMKISFINAYFETVSGFTTTGITIFTDIEILPKSIIFWRSLIQWLGGLGILTLFLAITFKSNHAYFQLFAAESHKIDSSRPTPSIFKTAMILWGIYLVLTFSEIIILKILGVNLFDAICHSFTTLSTGGFSPYNASIDYYRQAGFRNYKAIEYVITFFMFLGGMNFLLHFKLISRRFKEVVNDIELRYFISIITIFTFLIILNHCLSNSIYQMNNINFYTNLFKNFSLIKFEKIFRTSIFTVVSILTTTGFGTVDINDSFFPAMARQLLLISMLIGGCVGSTAGGIKVLRTVVLIKLFKNQLKRLRLPRMALSEVIIDNKIFPVNEIKRITGLFFGWLILLFTGGIITAFFTKLDAWQSFSGMFSAVGNIGPCFFSVQQMSQLPIVVKLTYIFGMLAGRLEILPVILIFNRKAWLG